MPKDIAQLSHSNAGKGPPSIMPQHVATMLLRGREALMRLYRAQLRPLDLTEQQWRILQALSNVSHLEVSELARAATLLGPSLSRILKDLDRRGLVIRTTDREDMRKAHIALSGSGHNMIELAAPKLAALDMKVSAVFGHVGQQELIKLLTELEDALQDMSSADTDDQSDGED